MILELADRRTSLALGLLFLSALSFAGDAVFGFRETESVFVVAMLTAALAAMTLLPQSGAKLPVRRLRTVHVVATLGFMGGLSTLVIRGDARSWFLVGLLVLASLLLATAATEKWSDAFFFSFPGKPRGKEKSP